MRQLSINLPFSQFKVLRSMYNLFLTIIGLYYSNAILPKSKPFPNNLELFPKNPQLDFLQLYLQFDLQ
jgi:hypothetical protein